MLKFFSALGICAFFYYAYHLLYYNNNTLYYNSYNIIYFILCLPLTKLCLMGTSCERHCHEGCLSIIILYYHSSWSLVVLPWPFSCYSLEPIAPQRSKVQWELIFRFITPGLGRIRRKWTSRSRSDQASTVGHHSTDGQTDEKDLNLGNDLWKGPVFLQVKCGTSGSEIHSGYYSE